MLPNESIMNLFRHTRKRIITWLFHRAQYVYTNHLKRTEPWSVSKQELLSMHPHTLGHHLGQFLAENGFDLIPRAERHDAYHVVTGYSTDIQDEIAQQYLCLANGKRSPFLFGVITVGSLLLPEYLPTTSDHSCEAEKWQPFITTTMKNY